MNWKIAAIGAAAATLAVTVTGAFLDPYLKAGGAAGGHALTEGFVASLAGPSIPAVRLYAKGRPQ